MFKYAEQRRIKQFLRFQLKRCNAILSFLGSSSRSEVSKSVSPQLVLGIFLLAGFLHRLLLSDNLCCEGFGGYVVLF